MIQINNLNIKKIMNLKECPDLKISKISIKDSSTKIKNKVKN